MLVGTVKTAELLHLNEAAKAIKQKTFQIVNYNTIIGLDNIDSCIKYTILDSSFYNEILNGAIINSRELSAFIKTITLEFEFEVRMLDYNTLSISSVSSVLNFVINKQSIINPEQKLMNVINSCRYIAPIVSEECITDNISNLFTLRKGDGCIYYKHHNKYFITLFSGLLPINKSDKIYLTIYPNNNNSFLSVFKISKKKFNVFVYVLYLYI